MTGIHRMHESHVAACVFRHALRCPRLVLLQDQLGNRSITSIELQQCIQCLVDFLIQRNIGSESRTALLGTCSTYYLQVLLAATVAGSVATLLNWRWTLKEIIVALQQTTPACLAWDEGLLPWADVELAIAADCPFISTILLYNSAQPSYISKQLVQHCRDKLPFTVSQLRQVVAALQPSQQSFPSNACPMYAQPSDGGAVIVFTSGSTGSSKAVLLSHYALCFQTQQKLRVVGYRSDDVYLHTAPLFHVGGLSSALAMLEAGATQIMQPKFSAEETLKLLNQYSVTSFIAVPTMITDLHNAWLLACSAEAGCPDSAGVAVFPSVRCVLVGGGSMSHDQQTQAWGMWPQAQLHTAYGMSETASSICFHQLERGPPPEVEPHHVISNNGVCESAAPRSAGMQSMVPQTSFCVGRPPNGVRVAIMSSDRAGDEHGVPGSVGQILTQGPHVMLRYWGDDIATKAAFDPASGYLQTGDLGYLDNTGCLWFVGRLKDIIKSGGENVMAQEVEAALALHPDVVEVAVVGVPDARLGEQVAAWVVVNQAPVGEESQLRRFRQWLQQRGLASYKLPRRLLVTAAGTAGDSAASTPLAAVAPSVSGNKLPRNSMGKVVKHVVRARLALQQSQNVSRL